MKTEIWIEGYIATGERGFAYKIAESEKENFEEAILDKLSDRIDKTPTGEPRLPHSIWGCKLFDNETDAKKSFG